MTINNIETSYPLSPVQQGMLFHTMYEQQPGHYIEQVVCHLHEAVELPLMLASWQQVVARHSILRSSFRFDREHQPQQIVHPQVDLPLIQQDWQGRSGAEQDARLAQYLQTDRQTKFEIAAPPLMRLALFQRATADYTLVWTFPHALLDGRSIAIVLREVFAFYDGKLLDRDCSLPPVSPYRDYIDWLQQQSWTSAETFWRETLHGFTTPTPIPKNADNDYLAHPNLDHGDSSAGGYGNRTTHLSGELTAALQQLATEHQLTLNTLVQGAWALLLSRYSGENDVVFGATRACRHSSLAAIESMVGIFINTLPVRVQINDATELLPWLKALRAQWVAVRDYEHTPLVKVQAWSDVPQGRGLFDSLLIFDNLEFDAAIKGEGSQWQDREFELIEQIPYPLILKAAGGSHLNLTIQFDRHQFTEIAVIQMFSDLETLLQNFVSDPQSRVCELETDRVKSYHQDLANRTYFGPSNRPPASSLLSFDVSSQDIYNLVRALEFGPTRNQLGVPKVWLPEGVVVVASALPIETVECPPGQVLHLDAEGLCIATIDGAVQLRGLSTLNGKPISVASLVADYGVRVGEILPTIDCTIRDAITERNGAICRHEDVWATSLIQLAPFQHPYLPVEVGDPTVARAIHRYPISVATTAIESRSLLAIFAAYCARLTTESEFDLGLQTDAQRSIAPEIFAQRVPLRVQIQAEESFSQFRSRLEMAIDRANRLGSYRHTLLRRYPELQDRATDLSVAIGLAPSPDRLDWQHLRASLAFVAYADGSLPEVVHAGSIDDAYSQEIVRQLQGLIPACLAHPDQPLNRLPLLTDAEQQKILVDWNQTAQPFPSHLCIHELFEQQVERSPNAIAVVAQGRELTYRELNARANQLAHYLRLQGVGPDVLVGLHVERSLEMMVGLLGIHKAGGAYVPLDPDFPPERIALMLQDSQAPAIVTQQSLISDSLAAQDLRIIAIDTLWDEISHQPTTNPDSGVKPAHLSYVIYTSGSTGKPKGVMVEHRNVVNFFTGMDAVIDRDPPSVWCAVTSLSFDISVLELCWTLARGFKVVIYNAKAERAGANAPGLDLQHGSTTVDFSLFYFSSNEQSEDAAEKYRLLLEGTKFADERGFKAVWTPERHFHAFGGLFPNSAVTSAAIAATTKQIQIRAGSCVAPLHSSIRIAEDWAVVDNLSGGRVGISFAAGWQPNDFVLRPETFDRRKDVMFQQIEEVRSLWRGEAVTYPNGKGEHVAVQTLPRPIQAELPIWITAAGNPETFQLAGAKGFNILTHLLGQSLAELAAKIAIYRQAWTENGHRGQGTVTLMIHTFVGDSNETVKEIVRQPMRHYLASSLDLIKQAAWSFPTFKQKTTSDNGQFSVTHLSEQDLAEVLDFSFERYFETSGLFGTVETCVQMVDQIKGIDVNEIGCLIDYGVDPETVLAQLPRLNQVRIRANQQPPVVAEIEDNSIAALIQRHQVTHLQCTPSMASLLMADPTTRTAIGQIRHMMVGGEALTETLASQLQQMIVGHIHNMYGPTETTIWSTTHTLKEVGGIVPLGRPIANTELYILDRSHQPVPVGMAGELLIGGQGVTRGYLNRPELTEDRFVPNPFSTDPTARLYRTGDLVRYRIDGHLEFLGRIDFQVKVRGYRIELGEIETILTRHTAVRAAIIIVREDLPGDKRLVAYLLPEPGHLPTSAELRSYLLSLLPEYMVPANFVLLAAFPLTPNQKIDRQALPAPSQVETKDRDRADEDRSLAPTQIEQTLIAIWKKVLQIAELGTQDNFFNLGGNSLVAMTLIGEMREAFDVELPLISLFRSPTILEMEREICQLQPTTLDAAE